VSGASTTERGGRGSIQRISSISAEASIGPYICTWYSAASTVQTSSFGAGAVNVLRKRDPGHICFRCRNDEKHQHVTPVIQQILGASGQPLGELIRAVNEFEGYRGEIEIIFRTNLPSDSKSLSFSQSTP
jgi:hypothetical protein